MIKAVIFDMYETLITLYESPIYFGKQMAMDAGIPEEQFLESWTLTEIERSTGKMTLEEAIKIVLVNNNCNTTQLLDMLVSKRIAVKQESFKHLHVEIIPLLKRLKQCGCKIGLISNCYSEEAQEIEKSVLYPYFDAACLSYREGIVKPNVEIFNRCMQKLFVNAEECLYVGDGGSMELETAKNLGMHPIQAVWYFKEGSLQPCSRKNDFTQAEKPLDILNYISNI